MKKMFLPAAALLLLSACGPDRAMTDKTLLSACTAGVMSLHNAAADTLEIKDSVFSSEKSSDGLDLRLVRMHAFFTQNGGVVQDKTYLCAFEENSGLWEYQAKLRYMDKDGSKYGNVDGTLMGDINDMMKINEAVAGALEKR